MLSLIFAEEKDKSQLASCDALTEELDNSLFDKENQLNAQVLKLEVWKLIHKNFWYCIQGNIWPHLFLPLSPASSEGKFKTGRIFLFIMLEHTTIVSWWI